MCTNRCSMYDNSHAMFLFITLYPRKMSFSSQIAVVQSGTWWTIIMCSTLVVDQQARLQSQDSINQPTLVPFSYDALHIHTMVHHIDTHICKFIYNLKKTGANFQRFSLGSCFVRHHQITSPVRVCVCVCVYVYIAYHNAYSTYGGIPKYIISQLYIASQDHQTITMHKDIE